jgi:hypothetical protein
MIDTLGLHILDYGFGASVLLTVRKIDTETLHPHKKYTTEQRSRMGILGRMISGIWVRLAQVIDYKQYNICIN